jgi:hypothetical protein
VSSAATSVIVFAVVFGAALLGIYLRSVLPAHHLSADSKDIVRMAMGLVATMAALVLGLLVASAKGNYDTQSNELIQMCANVIFLDRILASYGPEAMEARKALRSDIDDVRHRIWARNHSRHPEAAPVSSGRELFGGRELFYDKIQQLSPKDNTQRALQAEASAIAITVGKTRWLLFEQGATVVPMTLLVVVVFWLAIIFISFGLFAPRNLTVVISLAVGALSVSGAVLLILEMYKPLEGLIQISDAPLQAAFAYLLR